MHMYAHWYVHTAYVHVWTNTSAKKSAVVDRYKPTDRVGSSDEVDPNRLDK